MFSLKATITALTTILAISPSAVHAAECQEWDKNMQWFMRSYESQLWSLRQQACGDNACGNSQVCTLNGYNRLGNVKLYRKDVQYEYPNCWDAVSNIITQCERNWWKNGWWQYGDEFYQINTILNGGLKRDEGGAALEDDEWTFSIEAHNITET